METAPLLALTAPSTVDQAPGRHAADRIADLAIRCGILLAGVQIVSYLVDVYVLEGRVGLLDIDTEGSFFAWLGSVAIFANVVFLALLATALGRLRKVWPLLIVLSFLSADEIVAIHERLGHRIAALLDLPPWSEQLVWPAAYLPLLVIVVAMLAVIARDAPPRSAALIKAGVILLGVAVLAEGLSTISHAMGIGDRSVPDVIEVLVEENSEVLGWLLVAAALATASVHALTGDYVGRGEQPQGSAVGVARPVSGPPGGRLAE